MSTLPMSWVLSAPVFHGADFVPERDQARLTTQIQRIAEFMADGHWRSVREISRAMTTKYPESEFPENSVQAQLRNLRKLTGYQVDRNRVNGISVYKVVKW